MKLKNLIGIIVLGVVGYFGYNFLVSNYSAEAMVYKRYAEALLDAEPSRVKTLIAKDGTGMDAFQAGKERRELLNGDVRFTWYDFKEKQVSANGEMVTLIVVQKIRVDPPGEDTFYGKEVRKDTHKVVLQKNQSSWQIISFEDIPTAQYRAASSAR